MSLSKSRKRSYRYRVKCEECEKEFDSDYVEAHSRIVHSGRKVKCLPVVESLQLKLSVSSKSSAAVESPGQTQEVPLVECSPERRQCYRNNLFYPNILAPSSAVSLSLDDFSLTGIKSIHGLVTMSKKKCVYVLPA